MGMFKRMMDPKDSSVELHDYAGVGSLLSIIGGAIHNAFQGPIDLMSFGGALAAVIAAIQAAGWMKGKQRSCDPALKAE